MQASEFFAWIQQREQARTTPSHQPTAQEIRQATGSDAVDFHVEQATERE